MDGTGALFAPFVRALDPVLRPRVIPYPVDEPLGYAELVERIAVPSGPFVVIAESFSGPLGVMLAERHPAQLRALVLVASFVRRPNALVGIGAWLAPVLFRMQPPAYTLRSMLLGHDATDEDVAALRSAIELVHPSVMAHRLRSIDTVDVGAALGASTTPLLCMVGRRDRIVGASASRTIAGLRSDAEVRVLDAPHLVLQRQPIESAQLVGEFLSRRRVTAGG
jgi:pimeloyl-ACP methyl ester carboxylesterase